MTEVQNPYVGLRPFEQEDSLYFFGRQEQIIELLERLHAHRFVAVVGSSGSGKSSLIRAGLIPRLRAGYLVNQNPGWEVAIMKPGQNPIYNLVESICNSTDAASAQALREQLAESGVEAIVEAIKQQVRDEQTNYLLLVDQFEELFRFASSRTQEEDGGKELMRFQDEASDFVNLLLELSTEPEVPIFVILTMRSDFIGDCVQFYGLPEALNKSQYLVPQLSRGQRRLVIEGPAKLVGGQMHPGLTSKLLNEIEHKQDQLPLLQHILMRVWHYEQETDQNQQLDLGDYAAVGGLGEALSRHADEVLEELAAEQKLHVRLMFQCLTTVDEQGRKIRKPARLRELQKLTQLSKADCLSLLDRFITGERNFLVKSPIEHDPDDLLMDISHESLIRQWQTLVSWVDEEAQAAEVYLGLLRAYELFKAERRGHLSELEIAEVKNWLSEFKPSVIWASRYGKGFKEAIDFYMESQVKLEEARAQQKDYQEQKKRNRRLIWFMSIVGLLAAAAIYFAYTAKIASEEAEKEKHTAHVQREKAIEAQMIAESARREAQRQAMIADSLTHLAKGSAALAKTESKRAIKAAELARYSEELAMNQSVRATQSAEDARMAEEEARYQREEAHIAAEKANKLKQAYLLNSMAVDWEESDPTIALNVALHATEVIEDELIQRTAQQIYARNAFYKVLTKRSERVVFNRTGSHYLLQTTDSDLELYQSSGRLQAVFELEDTLIDVGSIIRLSPKGDRILIGNHDLPPYLIDTNSKKVINIARKTWDDLPIRSNYAFFLGSQGELMATDYVWSSFKQFSTDGQLKAMWDYGKQLDFYNDPQLVASSDGEYLLAFSGVSTVMSLFKTASNKRKHKTQQLNAGTEVYTAVISPNNGYLLAGLADYTAQLWDLTTNQITQRFVGHEAPISALAVDWPQSRVLTGDIAGNIKLWDLQGNHLKDFKSISDEVVGLSFCQGQDYFLSVDLDGQLKRWDLPGSLINTFSTGNAELTALASGQLSGQEVIATYSNKDILSCWDLNGNLLSDLSFAQTDGTVLGLGFATINDVSYLRATLQPPEGPVSPDFSVANYYRLPNEKESYLKLMLGVSLLSLSDTEQSFEAEQTVAVSKNEVSTEATDELILLSTSSRTDPSGIKASLSLERDVILYYENQDSIAIPFELNKEGSSGFTSTAINERYVIATDGYKLYLHDLSNSMFLGSYPIGFGTLSIALAADQNLVLTGNNAQAATLWEYDTQSKQLKQVHLYKSLSGEINRVAFSADGSKIITGSSRGIVQIWKVANTLKEYLQSGNVEDYDDAFLQDELEIPLGL